LTGVTPPFGDPRRRHGVAMDGSYWRFTWPDGRVAVLLCGVCGDWALAGAATTDGRGANVWRSRVLDGVERRGTAIRAGAAWASEPERVRVALADDCRVEAELRAPDRWPVRAWGGIGPAGWAPGLGQYWHPHVLRSAAEGVVAVGGDRWDLAGATAYAEKNWGNGFPARWWWGEAHDFGGDRVTVAFAGGPALGRLEATAVVVRVDGRLVRLGEPLVAPVRATVTPGSWRLTGRSARHRVEVEAEADPASAHVMDVPVPGEYRTVPWSHQHLAGRLRVHVRRRGRTVYEGVSELAGLEQGRAPR
jgi:Tocopherol cyclase